MKTSLTLLLFAFVLIAQGQATTETNPFLKKGQNLYSFQLKAAWGGQEGFIGGIAPGYGRFIADGFVIGMRSGIIISRQSQSLSLSPYVRYYFTDGKRPLFTEVHYRYENSDTYQVNEVTSLRDYTLSHRHVAFAGVGVHLFDRKGLGIEGIAGIELIKSRNWYVNPSTYGTFKPKLNLGLRFTFSR